jgi:ATP-dependent DNA helicase RecG
LGADVSQESIQKWVNEIKNKTTPSVIPTVNTEMVQNKKLIVFSVLSYPIKPVAFQGKFYKRIANSNHLMTSDEIADEHLKTLNSSWDYYPDSHHTFADLDMKKVSNFINLVEKQQRRTVDLPPKDFLTRFEFIRNKQITLGSYLLFAKEQCSISDVQAGRFKGETTIIDSISLNTDLFTEVNELLAFIRKHLMVEYVITGQPSRQERFDYPEDAIREIVINMIVHRDYRSSNASIIKIYDGHITFYNPGTLYGNLTIEDLLSGNYVSQTRNKLIAKSFKEVGFIERYGSGILRVRQICRDYGIIEPKFEEVFDGFRVTLFKEKVSSGELNDELNGELDTEEVRKKYGRNAEEILKIIVKNPESTTQIMAEQINVSISTIEKNIAKLKKAGIIERVGSTKSGYWKIVSSDKQQ